MKKAVIYARYSSDLQSNPKDEIRELHTAEPPKDFTPVQIMRWLDSFEENKNNESVVRLLIEKIEIRTAEIIAFSMLDTIVRETGCGDRI